MHKILIEGFNDGKIHTGVINVNDPTDKGEICHSILFLLLEEDYNPDNYNVINETEIIL